MHDSSYQDLVVVGAGIIGVSTAREALLRRPDWRLVVLEKETAIGGHQTAHNSGVIHSGLYYSPGSLKARLCIEGGRRLREFCVTKRIPVRESGKVVVATSRNELGRLEDLFRRGLANRIPGIRMISGDELREMEPNVRGLRAVDCPRTAIVDFKRVLDGIAEDVTQLGGKILTGQKVIAVARGARGIMVRTTRGEFRTRRLVTCAGLYADRLAQMSGGGADPRIVPFRGDYLEVRPHQGPTVQRLIYPVPNPAFPFLGIHVTPRMNGDIWLGPNAVLAFAREGYRMSSIRPSELAGSLLWPGMWRLARRYWRTGVAELYRDLSHSAFIRAVQRYLPDIRREDTRWGPSGVRAQALGRNGRLIDDFIFDHGDGILHVRNAPSPAATACLAIAGQIIDQLQGRAP